MIKLMKPYKIAPGRAKRYQAHYNVPALETLIVPLREFGDEVSCDIRWESGDQLHLLENKIFVSKNLVPLNPLIDSQLHEIWQHYYDKK